MKIPVLFLFILVANIAEALPRFAARKGAECTLCHLSPSGGGVRNRYGSQVFQQTGLPLQWGGDEEDESFFSSALTEWLTIGSDVRLTYLYAKPERAFVPGERPQAQSTFFLMQADLYVAATFTQHVALALDIGAYSGFEAWLLLRTAGEPGDFELFVKAGRFLPQFGVREVNHDLFTRDGIGLGASDRDSGVEVTGVAGPFSLSVSLLNGTLEDELFDSFGSEKRSFEKAIVSRLSARFSLFDWINVQAGASVYANDNIVSANPLFGSTVPAEQMALGINELRAGPFLLAALGRFVYLADVIFVQNDFDAPDVPRLRGYASYQELDVALVQGWELGFIFEFLEPNIDISGDRTMRFSVMTEVFPSPFVELRAMGRRTISDISPSGDSTELVLFAHTFF